MAGLVKLAFSTAVALYSYSVFKHDMVSYVHQVMMHVSTALATTGH